MKNTKPVIGITHGDINGVGYELIIDLLSDLRITDSCNIVIYGSSKVFAYHRKVLNAGNISINNVNSAKDINDKRINLVNCTKDEVKVDLGLSTEIAGQASFAALDKAVSEMKEGYIDGILTCPINKDNINSEYFTFPGHTEYLASEFNAGEILMLMVSDHLKVGVITGHIPLNNVAETITEELIINKVRVLSHTLLKDFGVRKPKIAVLGINPHAGDNGVIGNEDDEIVKPALERCREKGELVFGPFAADGFFGSGAYRNYDAVLAMYHDQGLVPFKTLVMDNGVNYTAGLPIVRTSPAHGTAYDIAGKGVANAQSFREALYLALDVIKNRGIHKEITRNPLRKQVMMSHREPDISVEDLEKQVGAEPESEI